MVSALMKKRLSKSLRHILEGTPVYFQIVVMRETLDQEIDLEMTVKYE